MRFLLFGKHRHEYYIRYTVEEMWLECGCGEQLDIPPELEEEAYNKIRKGDLLWKIPQTTITTN